MKKINVAAFSLMLLSSVILAGHAHSATDDDESITPSANPKKVDMRAVGNLPGNLAGKKVITADQLKGATAGTVVKPGKNDGVVIVAEPEQGVKTGKYLPSNRNANSNVQTVQIPGVGEVMVQGSGKKNHKNINQRTDEVMGGGDNF